MIAAPQGLFCAGTFFKEVVIFVSDKDGIAPFIIIFYFKAPISFKIVFKGPYFLKIRLGEKGFESICQI